MRRTRFTISALLVMLLGFGQLGLADEMWEKGRHYQELTLPLKTRDPSKIEVVEAFWYGCPHCYEFNNDHLKKWEASLPEDVDFWLVPATFPGWVEHAKVFYAAEFLGVREKMHQALFEAIQGEPKKYKTVADFKSMFAAHGVSAEDLDKVFEASGIRKVSKVDEAVKAAEDRIKSYRISGVPALIVNGKYKIGVQEAGNFVNMLKIANFLINKERESLKK